MKIAKMSVDYIDHMGGDLTVVNAARVSMSKHHNEFDLVADERLINYLARENHWSPFAHCQLQLRIKAPIFVARQLAKHQVGLVWNEVSRRYVSDEPEFWFPNNDGWRGKPVNGVKQGSHGEFTDEATTQFIQGEVGHSLRAYLHAIDKGMAPEQARMILPQNTMTEWYWTGSLYAFARVCWERMAEGSQPETRDVAQAIYSIAEATFPRAWRALMRDPEPEVEPEPTQFQKNLLRRLVQILSR